MRGETSRAMAHGLVIIVNDFATFTDDPDDVGVPGELQISEIAAAILPSIMLRRRLPRRTPWPFTISSNGGRS